jgi:uncharacterized repeat protein (TIGR01451 family)
VKYIFLSKPGFVTLLFLFLCSLVAAQTDLEINKNVNNPSPNLGENITFTLTVTNNGPVGATGVTVTDILPDGYIFVNAIPSVGTWTDPNWNIGNLIVGATETLQLIVTVFNTGNYTNNASVTCIEGDSNPVNDNATATITAPVFTSVMAFRVTKGNSVSFTFTTMDDFQPPPKQLNDWTIFQVSFYDDFNTLRQWGMTIEAESDGAIGIFTGLTIPLADIEIQFVTTTGLPVIPGFHDLTGSFGAPVNIITGGANHWANHSITETITISYRILNASSYPKDVYMLNLRYQMY